MRIESLVKNFLSSFTVLFQYAIPEFYDLAYCSVSCISRLAVEIRSVDLLKSSLKVALVLGN